MLKIIIIFVRFNLFSNDLTLKPCQCICSLIIKYNIKYIEIKQNTLFVFLRHDRNPQVIPLNLSYIGNKSYTKKNWNLYLKNRLIIIVITLY